MARTGTPRLADGKAAVAASIAATTKDADGAFYVMVAGQIELAEVRWLFQIA